jgi:acyl carrier protein
MTPEELIKLYPEFSKIGFSIYSEIIYDRCGIEFNPNKNWREMGLDDLDAIELVMELEKRFDFAFSDLHFDIVFGPDKKPIDFISYNRNKLIDNIINDK